MVTPPPTVLVIEDEKEIRRFVRAALESEGYRVAEADSLQRGLIEAGTRRPDLVFVDLGLPDGDGVDLIRELRAFSGAPVIVLSARTAEEDKVEALDAGADDYLVKPFGIPELLARTRAAMRRRGTPADCESPTVSFADVEVDLSLRRMLRAGAPVHLTPVEFRLLAALLAIPTKCSRIASCCAKCGALPMWTRATTCASTWRIFDRSSRPTRRDRDIW